MWVLVCVDVGGRPSPTLLHYISLCSTWLLRARRAWLGIVGLNGRVLCFPKIN